MTQAILHASELWTGVGFLATDGRHPTDTQCDIIEDGALVHDGKKILWTGKTKDLPKRYAKVPSKNLKQKRAVTPGLVDCHTHLVFAGDRANEFARRCAGTTYQDIAKEGGGILKTVTATRKASEKELLALAQLRLKESQSWGVRTIEIKSGYALSVEGELKCLRIIKKLKKLNPDIHIEATFMGAHAYPVDQSRSDYFASILNDMLPVVASEKLATACDIFVDEGYFSVDEARILFEKASTLGLATKIHADELGCTQSAELAADMKCLSADHLLKISPAGIKKIAKSETVAVLLPGTAFYLKAAYAPARELIDAGAAVAISTDFNPGTCMTLSLPTVMTLSALYLGMSRAEIFAAVTYNAAKALGVHKRRGVLAKGFDPAVWILPFARFEESYYRFAWNT